MLKIHELNSLPNIARGYQNSSSADAVFKYVW